jgi:thioredoxin
MLAVILPGLPIPFHNGGRVDQQIFQSRLAEQIGPVIVYFWAPWCLPCRVFSPAIEKIKETYSTQITLWKLNADEHPQLLRDLAVYGIPTLIAFQDGSEVTRQSGALTKGQLEGWVQMLLTGEKPTMSGMTLAERLLRIGAGVMIGAVGLLVEPTFLFFLAGGLVAFTGIHDRCPIWQAIRARLFPQAG